MVESCHESLFFRVRILGSLARMARSIGAIRRVKAHRRMSHDLGPKAVKLGEHTLFTAFIFVYGL